MQAAQRDLGGGTFDAAYSWVRRGRTSVCADLGVQAVQWGDLGGRAGAGRVLVLDHVQGSGLGLR